MAWLVLQTFVLVIVALAIGVALGVVTKLQVGRPRAALAGAGGAAIMPDLTADRPASTTAPVAAAAPTPTAATEVDAASAAAAEGTDEALAVGQASDAIIDAGKAGIADQVGVRPAALPAPRDHAADDLKAIKGVGPQNEARLNALGIFHFAQIAAWSPEEARWVGAYLAFPGRIEREDWIGQAKMLAAAGPAVA